MTNHNANRNNRLIEWSVFNGPLSNLTPGIKLLNLVQKKYNISINKKIKNRKKQYLPQNKKSNDEHDRYLKNLDPKEWRKQDHYAVLGLEYLRFDAKESDVKQAYRKLVLRHHPDKRPPNERSHKDSDYFSCITKAWEVLGNKALKRAYDSIDPYFDDDLPSGTGINQSNFFRIFPDYFKRNERWSEITPVPTLGNANTSREVVEKFYNFWFNFHSWRDYSYEFEDPESNLDRGERRWIEKQNKANRMKQKKEEMSRIRKLVDMAYMNDPRIKKFKLEDKEKKIATKRAKEEEIKANQRLAAQLAKEAEEKERHAKEKEEAKKQQEQDALKAEQAQVKKSLKRIKKNIRDICKQNEYYAKGNNNKVVDHMTLLEQMFETLSLEELSVFQEHLHTDGEEAFLNKADEIKQKIKEERMNLVNGVNSQKEQQMKNGNSLRIWSQKELQLLIKAVNLFPAGTSHRWEVIANFLSQHAHDGITHTANDILLKAKEMQKMRQNPLSEESREIINLINNTKTWTNTEQQLLEQGLKLFSSHPNKWNKIAEHIPTRTKEEVIQRYKDLVEAVKAKREAQNSSS